MNENVKSGIVLVGALFLGGLLVAGLVQQVELGRGGDRTPEQNTPSPPAVQNPAEPALPDREAPTVPPAPPAPVPAQQTLVAPEANRENVPTVDFFGKPLDAFARQVNERVGIAGQVVMAGRPVPGAKVVMRRVSRKIVDGAPDYTGVTADPPGGQEWSAETDAEGRYAFYDLDDGHYGLEAYTDSACGVDDMTIRGGSIPGRYPGSASYFAGRAHMSIELWPAGALSGRVLTADGQPVAGAAVYPYQIQYPTGTVKVEPVPSVLLGVTTGEDGSFHFPRLPAGRWQLAVHAGGYTDQTTDWLHTAAPSAEIRLKKPEDAARSGAQPADSTPFNLSDYKGKYVLMDFWTVWCVPCKLEMPNFRAVWDAYKNDPRLVMLGMNLDGDPKVAKQYVTENNMGWQHISLGDWTKSTVARDYGVTAIPFIMLLDTEGKELARDLRGQGIMDAVRKVMDTPERQAAE